MKERLDTMEELNNSLPDKHEVARQLGIPLDQGHNEDLTTQQVGKIGGKIGGEKVKRMIEMAEASMAENAQKEAVEAKASGRTDHTV
ncbi:hypothetical protein P22_2926 [Propionispora sp. 2/2-37]|uniref:small, acid-soluble spore protein, alpha/beta type n=1 Tax=Propionispora sp. 2/2-37 TaxID=1677858 RepID=UPI0006BB85EF|nr:small, acid-soluble spore protein, alpha/beta type [Propionispora sp. 2/2-37]CUH96815.1 hypothetical protein P22_2926 [Propionispora sp. 2/2-37]